MAGTGRNYLSRPTYRFFPGDGPDPVGISDSPSIELDESDVWNSPPQPLETKKSIPSSRMSKKSMKRGEAGGDGTVAAASSLPVNIPDWSKILREDSRRRDFESESDEDDVWIPPHEFLAKQFARTRIASFSVHEGVGRTLKGRDLSRVRNAIWQKTGFED